MVIGVTGGVGSGKSTILNILKENYGAYIIQSDDVAKELMEPGMESYRLIVENFGERILISRSDDQPAIGEERPIDRAALASVVFSSPEKRLLLNSLTHPQVKREIIRRIRNIYALDQDAMIIIEAALLIEANYTDILDHLWVVIADREVRIGRLISSRGYSREKCESVMASQLSDDEFIACADYVVDNSGTRENTALQIAAGLAECGYNA